jgi:excisionase family DNA binding protein
MENYITTSEAAARLGITRQRIGQLVKAGRLPATSYGGGNLLLIRPADLAPLMHRKNGRPKTVGKTRVKPGRKKLR